MKLSLMPKTFPLRFPNGHLASAIRVSRASDLSATVRELNLPCARPTLVLVGGASGMTPEGLTQLQSLFVNVLAPLMETLSAPVVDGGTDAGVMKLMGQARAAIAATFPLIGVAASGTVILPSDAAKVNDHSAPLEPNHSHFVLVPGALWGDEAPWIAQFASALAQNAPSVTILINGGKIAWQDVSNSVRVGRPVLVVAGSGRTADELAAAIQGEFISDRATALVNTGLLHMLPLNAGTHQLADTLKQLLFRGQARY